MIVCSFVIDDPQFSVKITRNDELFLMRSKGSLVMEQRFADPLDPPELCATVIETAEAIVQFHAGRKG